MASARRRSSAWIRARYLFTPVMIGVLLLGMEAVALADAPCSPSSTVLYEEAHHAFTEMRFDDTVELLRRAYACDANPVYLANIARAYEEANRPKDALGAWREYLAVVTNPQERTGVEGRISALAKVVDDLDRLEREKQAADLARRKAEAAAQARLLLAPPPPPPIHRVPLGAWITTSAGGAGLVGGVVLWLLASSKHSSATQELQQHQDPATAEAENRNAQSLAQTGNITFAGGGLVTAIGLTWAGISLLGRSTQGTSTVGVSVTTTSLQVTGHF